VGRSRVVLAMVLSIIVMLLNSPLQVLTVDGEGGVPYISIGSYAKYSLAVSSVDPLSKDVNYTGVLKDMYDVENNMSDIEFRLTYVVEDIGVDSLVIRYEIESLSPDMEPLNVLVGSFTVDREGHYLVLPWGKFPFLNFLDPFKAEVITRGGYTLSMDTLNATVTEIRRSEVRRINYWDWYYRAFEIVIFMDVTIWYPEYNVSSDLSKMFWCTFDALSGVAYRCTQFVLATVDLVLLDTNLPLSELPRYSIEGLIATFFITHSMLWDMNPLLGFLFGLIPFALIMLLVYVLVRIVRRLRM